MRILAVTLLAAALVACAGQCMAQSGRSGEFERELLGDNRSLIANRSLRANSRKGHAPNGFVLSGDTVYGRLGDARREISGPGIRLFSATDVNNDGEAEGSVSTRVAGITKDIGRWFRFRIRGLAHEGFHVEKDALYLKVAFFKNHGTDSLDHITKSIYAAVVLDRTRLKDPGTNPNLGSAVWRTFSLDFRTPFPEVDTLWLSAGFERGAGKRGDDEFWINEIELFSIPVPAEHAQRTVPDEPTGALERSQLVSLGGRWYYDARGGDRTVPQAFNDTNADRLLYRSDRFIAPFSGNMTSWLRKGYLDLAGRMVQRDRMVRDNVVIHVTRQHLVIRSHNLPNHPTAVFPDRWRYLDGNPNYIQEQDATWYLPLEPVENPQRVAMKNGTNESGALPMGPIGVAVNGVVFFNPFDHLQNDDAIWRLDRCCGHPAPGALYHYHKYPVCVKSPWTDDGTDHSPVIGFAFDGYPVYGPYESSGNLAKDSRSNPLNEFNVHVDDARGWHYHVTPGKFPHIIGGYWGVMESGNRAMERRRPPPRRFGPQRKRLPPRRFPPRP